MLGCLLAYSTEHGHLRAGVHGEGRERYRGDSKGGQLFFEELDFSHVIYVFALLDIMVL